MNLSFKSNSLAYFFALTTSQIAMAADISTINITGNVLAAPCTIDAASSVMNIQLDNIQATQLSTPGSSSPWKDFSIKLGNCPVSTTLVNVVFSGTADPDDADRYINTGTAGNLSIELAGSSGENFGNGKRTSVLVNSASKEAIVALKTRAYSVTGGVTPGTINSTVLATFTYQ